MTIEQEIENSVTMKAKTLSEELKKILPSIKQVGDKIKGIFKNIDLSDMTKQLQQSVKLVKDKLKEINQNNEKLQKK